MLRFAACQEIYSEHKSILGKRCSTRKGAEACGSKVRQRAHCANWKAWHTSVDSANAGLNPATNTTLMKPPLWENCFGLMAPWRKTKRLVTRVWSRRTHSPTTHIQQALLCIRPWARYSGTPSAPTSLPSRSTSTLQEGRARQSPCHVLSVVKGAPASSSELLSPLEPIFLLAT